ncbi:MAG: helix-turn-helix transcriptional regulator [Thermodesulfovibrionia bacterium]
MKKNIFWDKDISIDKVKNILKDESHPRFIYFAALLLSRTSDIKEVFTDYLDKVVFCVQWRKIKQKMRKDKWNNPKINFWKEVYRVVLQKMDINEKQIFPKRDELKNPELRALAGKIKEARKKMGWTQKRLAENVGLSQQTISFIEKGNLNFSFESLMKIISALNFRISLEPKNEYPRGIDTSSPYSFSLDMSTKHD